eukprot:evm.model.scf_1468.1 EVM.evm.TU.scf_1468.1   scf_1468:17108-23001(+)
MDTVAYPADPELSIRGAYSGHQMGSQPLNEFRDAHPSLQEEIQKPSAASHQSQEPPRPRRMGGAAAVNTDGPVDEMTVRGRYIPPGGLGNSREQAKDAYLGQGTNSVQDTTMANPPKPVSPTSNGHELAGGDGPELPMSTSADMMAPANEATPSSQWKWVQGVFSFSKKDDLDAPPEPEKENVAGNAGSAVASRDLPPSAVLAERQGQEGAQPKGAGETAAGNETKSAPGVWIKSVWGTRQEVAELDLAIQLALEVEQIDTAKYFGRDYTEFPSVAHYYVHVHDQLDMEEVDLLASFAGRMGEDHPLVQAMMEIMEEEGENDGAVDPPEASGAPPKPSPRDGNMGVFITESGMLSSVPPGGPSPVANLPKKPSPADPKRPDIHPPSERRKQEMGKKPVGLVPGMDDLVNDLSAMSWLSKRKPWKPGQPILDDEEREEGDTPGKEAKKQPKPRKSSAQNYGQSPALQSGPTTSAASPPAPAPAKVKSPKRAPVKPEPKDKELPKSPGRSGAANSPQAAPAHAKTNSNGAKMEVPPVQSLARDVAASNAQHYANAPARERERQQEPVKESRGLLDILCCRRPQADEDF